MLDTAGLGDAITDRSGRRGESAVFVCDPVCDRSSVECLASFCRPSAACSARRVLTVDLVRGRDGSEDRPANFGVPPGRVGGVVVADEIVLANRPVDRDGVAGNVGGECPVGAVDIIGRSVMVYDGEFGYGNACSDNAPCGTHRFPDGNKYRYFAA